EVASASNHVLVLLHRRDREFEDVAHQIVDAEWAARCGVRPDDIGAVRRIDAAIRQVEVRVARRDRIANGKQTVVSSARGALPLELGTEAGAPPPAAPRPPHPTTGAAP